jgi:hypothetical protein
VVQTHGSKSWKLYAPSDGYQLPNQPSGDLEQVRALPGTPATALQQQQGDCDCCCVRLLIECTATQALQLLQLQAAVAALCTAGMLRLHLWHGPSAGICCCACFCLQDSLGKPVLEVELCVGDVLYMPRGTVHQATAQTGDSSHLTISTYQRCSYADLATHLLQVHHAQLHLIAGAAGLHAAAAMLIVWSSCKCLAAALGPC